MKKILHLTLFLAIIAAVSGGALAFVNSVTKPIIDEAAIAEVKLQLEKFFPGATFAEQEAPSDTEFITNIYDAKDKGTIYKVSVNGFKDVLVYLVAIDNNDSFVGYSVQQNLDTQGFGSRVNDAEFYDAFIGNSIDQKIDTLAGATVSSSAIVKGIDEVVNYHKSH